MDNKVTGELSGSAADFYEEFFVPALFAGWTAPVLDAAGVSTGHRVLDVGCGTGVLARAALLRVQPEGAVVGLDRSEGMLATARRTAPDIDWHLGQVEELPFEDASFDRVVSQFALMFFEDRVAGLAEMWRVLKPGGRLAVAVWDSLENTPGYYAMTVLQARLFGESVAEELRIPYALGEREELISLFHDAGVMNPQIETKDRTARYKSVAAWVDLDVKGWTLYDIIGEDGYQTLLGEADTEMARFVQPDGSVAFRSPAHIVAANRPA